MPGLVNITVEASAGRKGKRKWGDTERQIKEIIPYHIHVFFTAYVGSRDETPMEQVFGT